MESTSPNKSGEKHTDFISNKEKMKVKPYYDHEKEIFDFLNSKFEAMEKMNLNEESLLEDEIGAKKININKKEVPNAKDSQNKKNRKKSSRKKSENKNKNNVLNSNEKIKKAKKESIDLVDVNNLDIEHEMKKKDANEFFSNKTLLNSIINEFKGK